MKVRIISGLVAALIIAPLIILGGYPYIIGVSILSILAYKEITDLKISHQRYPNGVKILGLIGLLAIILNDIGILSFELEIPLQTVLLTFLMLIIPTIFYKDNKYTTLDAFYLFAIVIFLGLAFKSLLFLRMENIYLLLYVILIPMFTDMAALSGGMHLGKHKLCPSISPKKTWEGAIVGLIFGSVGGIIVYSCLVKSFSFKIVILSILLSIVGQMGDLIMSKVKRENDIKDFSNIMPGHGGILDRLDSIIFVTLTYMMIAFWI